MVMKTKEATQDKDWFWYTKKGYVNEDGWSDDYGDTTQYRPDLDREFAEEKARCILTELHEGHFLYVSNGTMGDGIAASIARTCRAENRYDQEFIVPLLT